MYKQHYTCLFVELLILVISKYVSGQNPSLHNDDVSKDPLFITTRLLSDALTRLRIFVFGLDPMQWLSWRDRNVLYTSQICCLAVLKASVGVGTYTCILELFHSIFITSLYSRTQPKRPKLLFLDLQTAPMAYPLPYGEYLGEVEALHLILAHDLYTELRQIISHVQVRFLVTCKISIFSVIYLRILALHQHHLFSFCCSRVLRP